MRVAAVTITSLLFAWQVLAGCCPHHSRAHAHGSAHTDSIHVGHDDDCHAAEHSAAEHSDGEHCDHADSSHDPAHDPAHGPDGPAPCSCGQCRSIYLKANVTRIDSGDLLTMGAALAPPAGARASLNLRALRRELLGPIHRSGPPLPLLLCALLL